MSFIEHKRSLSLANTELLTQIVARAQNSLPQLADAVERFCENEYVYWDPLLQWVPMQRVIDSSIALVGLRDLDFIGDFSVTMEFWETLNELGALLHTIIRLERNELSQTLLRGIVGRLEKTINDALLALTRERLLWAWGSDLLLSPTLASISVASAASATSAVERPVPISL